MRRCKTGGCRETFLECSGRCFDHAEELACLLAEEGMSARTAWHRVGCDCPRPDPVPAGADPVCQPDWDAPEGPQPGPGRVDLPTLREGEVS